jgi:hypothetical protein
MEFTRYLDAANRHIHSATIGVDIDEDSGRYHLSNAIASLMMALDNQLTGTIKEDRNPFYLKIANLKAWKEERGTRVG